MSPRQEVWVGGVVMLLAAVIFTQPAAWSGSGALVGRHFDLQGTVWLISAAPRFGPGGLDLLSGLPEGARYARLDSWTLAALARALSWLDPVRVHNALQVLGVWLSAWAAERFAAALGARAPASWLAGLSYGMSGLAASALLEGHVYHLLDPFLPLCAWAWWRASRLDGRAIHGALAALGFGAALLTTAYHGVVAAVLVVVIGAASLWRRELRAVPAGVAALGALAFGLPYVFVFLGAPDEVAVSAPVPAAGLLAFTPPSAELDRIGHSLSAHLPATTLALASLCPFLLREHLGWRRLWLAGAACAVLALGPSLSPPQGAVAALPAAALQLIEGGALLRFPVRFAWGCSLLWGALAARAAMALGARLPAAPFVLIALMVVDLGYWGGMPGRQRSQPAGAPSAYAGEGPVLDLLPEHMGRQDELSAQLQALVCSYQVWHRRPIADDCVTPFPDRNPRIALSRGLVAAAARGEGAAYLRARGFVAVALHPDLFAAGDRARLLTQLGALDPAPAISLDHGEKIVVYTISSDPGPRP